MNGRRETIRATPWQYPQTILPIWNSGQMSFGSQKLLRFYITVKSQHQREAKQGQQTNVVNKLFHLFQWKLFLDYKFCHACVLPDGSEM